LCIMDLSEILVGVVERVMLLECQAPRLWRGIFDFSLTSNFYQDEESQNGSPKGTVEKVISENRYSVGTGLVPVLTLKRTATRAVPTNPLSFDLKS